MLTPILHALLLAFGLILPLGVQNVFVFNQGASHAKFRFALPVVLTAAICDTLLIGLAIMGVSVLILGLPFVKTALLIAGILFLGYMGFVTWRSEGGAGADEKAELSPRKQIAYALSVSLLNPHAILDTIGVIGTSSLQYSGSEKLLFALACIAVSWIWFFSLALAGRFVGSLDKSGKLLNALSKISALIIWASAIAMAVMLARSL